MPSKIPLLLASGRAIIGSVPASGTAAKAIRKSGGGLVVKPESPSALAAAVMDLYSNAVKREMLGKKGREFAVERYSFEQALDQYEQLFADAIANPALDLDILPKFTSSESPVDI